MVCGLIVMAFFLKEKVSCIFSYFKYYCLYDLTWQVETMFEKYNFAGVFIQIQAVLTLYAQGAYRDE